MYKRKRVLLLSSSVILLCCCLLVGATYALFTDRATVTHHLQAGKLDIQLHRNYYEYTIMKEDGTFESVSTTDGGEYTDASTTNLFGITKGVTSLMAPGCYFETSLNLTNNGTVAFDYSVSVVLKSQNLSAAQEAFANQMWITMDLVTYDGAGEETGRTSVGNGWLKNGITFDQNTPDQNTTLLNGNTTQNLVIRAEFVNDENYTGLDNNDTTEAMIEFDVIVFATQLIPD